MPEPSEPPVCISIVLCNDFIEDRRTGNKTLISLFSALGAPSLPVTHPKLVVMLSITNAASKLPLTLLITGPSGNEVTKVNADFVAENKLMVYDLMFEFIGLSFAEYGTYNVDVHIGSSYLCGRRFDVVVPAPPAQ